ncbi:Uncharacterised protein [Mycobacteroides abscessus subsp. abscessus]|nr:Uncharacterised protein [Mycobacteroides abscessus subsp. abscessus]
MESPIASSCALKSAICSSSHPHNRYMTSNSGGSSRGGSRFSPPPPRPGPATHTCEEAFLGGDGLYSRRLGNSPATTDTSASRMTTRPRAPASTTPLSASTSSCLGVFSSAETAASAAVVTRTGRSSDWASAAASAAASSTETMVPSTGVLMDAMTNCEACRNARRTTSAPMASWSSAASAIPRTICDRITPELPRAP